MAQRESATWEIYLHNKTNFLLNCQFGLSHFPQKSLILYPFHLALNKIQSSHPSLSPISYTWLLCLSILIDLFAFFTVNLYIVSSFHRLNLLKIWRERVNLNLPYAYTGRPIRQLLQLCRPQMMVTEPGHSRRVKLPNAYSSVKAKLRGFYPMHHIPKS